MTTSFVALDDVSPPPGARLSRALFTTYDAVDRELLQYRFLPRLLGLPPLPTVRNSDDYKRSVTQFSEALRAVRHRIVVVSSSPISGDFGWLRSYLDAHQIGADRPAVLHAKLWMLEWIEGRGRRAWLDVIISSTNLTTDSFAHQIQAGWRARVAIKGTQLHHGWGSLPSFLAALGRSCDTKAIDPFISLLKRSRCPEAAKIVSTAPGVSGDLRRAFRGKEPTAVRIATPFTGTWDGESLERWLTDNGCKRKAAVEIAALAKKDTLPESSKWALPARTVEALSERSNVVFGWAGETFSRGVRNGLDTTRDKRWFHAKLYEFASGKHQSLLVTSANFTPDAWNAKNRFELGVLLEREKLPWKKLSALELNDIARLKEPGSLRLAGVWGRATWDGDSLRVLVRCDQRPLITIVPGGRRCVATNRAGIWTATVPWRSGLPQVVRIVVGECDPIEIAVLDLRADAEDLPVGDLDNPAEELRLRDQYLLEKYGAPIDDTIPAPRRDLNRGRSGGATVSGAGDYSVEVLRRARDWFGCVDGWQKKYNATVKSGSQGERSAILDDGSRLRSAFGRLADEEGALGRAAAVVGEELSVRLVDASPILERRHG